MNFATLILIATLNGAGTDVASVDDRPYLPAQYNASDPAFHSWVPTPGAQYREVDDGSHVTPLNDGFYWGQSGWSINPTHAIRQWSQMAWRTVVTLDGGSNPIASTVRGVKQDYTLLANERLVANGAKPNPSTTSKVVVQTGWTIDSTTATRVWGETDIPSSILTARKREQAMTILQNSIATETEPDFSTAGISNSPIATKVWVTGQVGGGPPSWASITSKPTTISGFGIIDAIMSNDARLTDARVPLAHTQAWSTITATPTTTAGYGITDAVATNDARLTDARTPLAHTQAWSTITTTPTTVAGYGITDFNSLGDARWSGTAHNHTGVYQPLAAVLTNTTASFTTTLDAKLSGIATGATANAADAILLARANHTGTQNAATISDFSAAADARIAAASVNAASDVTVTAPSVGQVLKWNGSAWVNGADETGGGGGDPWTYVVLGADFSTTSATAVDVTGLAFTPLANQNYEVDGQLRLRTAATATGPRPGCAWPTGLTDGVATLDVTAAAGTKVMANGNIAASLLTPVGGLPTTTGSWPGKVDAVFTAGPTPSGTFKIQLASETAGTSVTIKAGSFIRYRTY